MDPRDRDAKLAKAKEKQALLDRAFDRIIGSQLKKISSIKQISGQDEENYRKSLEDERVKASKRKRKTLSKEHEELARTTGLSGQVVALMTKEEFDDDDDDDDSRDFKKAKKKKKRKKEKRSNREERAHGESKSRKTKKSRRKHHKSRQSCSSDDSSSNGGESNDPPHQEQIESVKTIEG
jgi:hypothetical protein